MNTLDLYDFTLSKPATPVPPDEKSPEGASGSSSTGGTAAAPAPEPTLNDEVNQALGQLNRFWGGFRASSQSALKLARKDFGQVVEQARAEIGKIAHDVTEAATSPPATREPVTSPMDIDAPTTSGADVKGKGKEKDPSELPSSPRASTDSSGAPTIATGLFARLQSRMPPNLQPSAIAASLTSATSVAPAVDLANIRTTLTANIQRAQASLPLAEAEKLAEGYLHRSQELFKEAGQFLQDAVKVVPPPVGPDGQPLESNTQLVVSGTDVFMFDSPIGTAGWGGSAAARESSATPPLKEGRNSVSSLKSREGLLTGHLSQATRAEALLRRLKYDPEMLRLDPSKDETVSAAYAAFVDEVNTKLGGISGDTMVTRISNVLKAGPAGELDADAKALIDNRDLLVPTELTNDVFWTRYFFRVQQITSDEEKRKALLANAHATQGDEDFSWEDDEDEPTPSSKTTTSAPTSAAKSPSPAGLTPVESTSAPHRVPSNPTIQSLVSASNRRLSSDDGSYDVVGEESVASTRGQSPANEITPSLPAAAAHAEPAKAKQEPKAAQDEEEEEDSDSDWE